MARITLNQLAQTRIPGSAGTCINDTPQLASYANEAIQRLIFAGGETGWAGGWWPVVFDVDPDDPYIVCPREIVRLINANICRWPVRIANQFEEYLPGGPGLQTKCSCSAECCQCGTLAIYDRGTVPTEIELTATNQKIRVYITDSRDKGYRLLVSKAMDQNGLPIFSQDGLNPVDGFYLTFDTPFETSTMIVTDFNDLLKDATFGEVIVKQVDATTGVEKTLSRLLPDERTAAYRKYFIQNFPKPTAPATTRQVNAIAKLEYIPLVRGTDFLLIGNVPALKEAIASVRYGEMDSPTAQAMSLLKMKNAIKILNDELRHTQGEQNPALTFPVAGLDNLACQRIGTMV